MILEVTIVLLFIIDLAILLDATVGPDQADPQTRHPRIQTDDDDAELITLKARFTPVARALSENEATIGAVRSETRRDGRGVSAVGGSA